MKRLFAIILAVLMISALFAACGSSKTVTTVVSKDYDDGYAKDYADKVSTDDKGNTTYEFKDDKYDEYVSDHSNIVSREISSDVREDMGEDFGQFSQVRPEENSVVIGVNPGKYNPERAEALAATYAKSAFKVFQSLENPVSVIKIVFLNANNQNEIYGTFEIDLNTLK